ncbi:MAG: hypothetical protein KDJ65_20310 [Anaerolineae bacterium]|nr:hypothetical protein [Anaerolineae bacterium]
MSIMMQQTFNDFAGARHRILWERISNIITNKPGKLLSFYEVQRALGLHISNDKGLQEISIDQIVGSVGRHQEFTRSFLPKNEYSEQRWCRVDGIYYQKGFEPIRVYKVSHVYFVVDGNHRVSVSRTHRIKTIEAYVVEYPSPIAIHAGDDMAAILHRYQRCL